MKICFGVNIFIKFESKNSSFFA